jgi:hypothetical protein
MNKKLEATIISNEIKMKQTWKNCITIRRHNTG